MQRAGSLGSVFAKPRDTTQRDRCYAKWAVDDLHLLINLRDCIYDCISALLHGQMLARDQSYYESKKCTGMERYDIQRIERG